MLVIRLLDFVKAEHQPAFTYLIVQFNSGRVYLCQYPYERLLPVARLMGPDLNPPPAMLLGATVTGQLEMQSTPTVDIPASALTRVNQKPAVWVVDPTNMTVSPRNIEVLRFDPGAVAVSSGLDTGEIVVTAGVQALYPGQKVRLLGSS